jgi:glyoxylase-like metal-dependent hydrolase (beta-lactamase superfamily II)
MEYSLRAMLNCTATLPGPISFYLSHWDEVNDAPHFLWLAQGGGRTILINTGLPQDPGDLQILNDACLAIHSENYFPPDRIRPPQDVLAEAGTQLEDVDTILIISPVSYATGNIELFPNAEIYMSRTGWIDFMAPQRPAHFDRRVIYTDATITYLVTEAWDRIHLVGDEEEVLPGIKMFWVGCHHRGSMAVSIQTAKGKVVISDSIFTYENLEKGTPIGAMENIFECEDAHERVREEAEIVFPNHDNEVLVRYPDGIIA